MRAPGIATAQDVTDFFRMNVSRTRGLLSLVEYGRATITSLPDEWYINKKPCSIVDTVAVTALLPLVSLTWTRARQRVLLGITANRIL